MREIEGQIQREQREVDDAIENVGEAMRNMFEEAENILDDDAAAGNEAVNEAVDAAADAAADDDGTDDDNMDEFHDSIEQPADESDNHSSPGNFDSATETVAAEEGSDWSDEDEEERQGAVGGRKEGNDPLRDFAPSKQTLREWKQLGDHNKKGEKESGSILKRSRLRPRPKKQ